MIKAQAIQFYTRIKTWICHSPVAIKLVHQTGSHTIYCSDNNYHQNSDPLCNIQNFYITCNLFYEVEYNSVLKIQLFH